MKLISKGTSFNLKSKSLFHRLSEEANIRATVAVLSAAVEVFPSCVEWIRLIVIASVNNVIVRRFMVLQVRRGIVPLS